MYAYCIRITQTATALLHVTSTIPVDDYQTSVRKSHRDSRFTQAFLGRRKQILQPTAPVVDSLGE